MHRKLALLTSLFLALVLVACVAPAPGTAPETAPSEADAETAETSSQEARPNTVIIGMSEELEFLNVLYTQGGNSLSASKLAQRGLLFLDEESNWIGELAEEVPTLENGGVSEDGLTITYKLREGITFHDGEPVTSADVKATWEMIMNPENAVITRFGYDKIESIETPDDHTVIIHFSQIFSSWPILFDAIVPQHIIEANSPGLDESEAMRQPIGFGPYKILEWVPSDFVEYEANPDYFRGAPQIERLIIKFYPSVDTLMQAIEAKEVDIGWALPVSNIPQIQALESKGVNLVSAETTGSDRYHMNPAEPLFQDVRVRRALHHAIDRQAIIDEQLFGYGAITNSEWGGSPWENTELPVYEYSPQRCLELMAEAGWTPGADGILEKDGQKFSFTHLTWSGNLQRANTQLIVQQMMKDCGVDMKLETRRSAELFGTWEQNGVWSHGEYQMGGWAHSLRVPDPEVSNRFLCSEVASEENPAGSQWYRYCNPEVDALLLAQANELDPAARTELLHQAQELIHADAYTIFLFRSNSIYTARAELQNFVLHPFANFYWNPQEWAWE
jgi:peptide/nickel transport system substrate-binding protein